MQDAQTGWGEFFTVISTLVFLVASIFFAYMAGFGVRGLFGWSISPFIASFLSILSGCAVFIGSFVFLSRMWEFLSHTFFESKL